MNDIPYKILKQKQKFNIKMYAILCLITVVITASYVFFQWQDYVFARDGINDGGETVDTLKADVLNQEAEYKKSKLEFDAFASSMNDKIEVIFPSKDNYTALTKEIDDISFSLASKSNTFEISNLSFQNVIETEDYNVLPFRMNIKSSNKNFTKFLHKIENSGSLDQDNRLMDVSSIRLNFENFKDDTSTEYLINFSVQINAYFQKQK